VNWKGSTRALLLIVGILMAVALLPTINGCTNVAPSSLDKVFKAIGGHERLPAEATREFTRFADVFQQYSSAPDNKRKLEYFKFAFKRLRASYVRPVSDTKLIDAAIKGVTSKHPEPSSVTPGTLVENALNAMMASLDPHSAYLNAEQFRESFVHTKGEFGGLGIEVTMEDGFVMVVAPIEDTPAFHAGMKSGDLITHVDREAIKGKTLLEAVRLMRGRPGTVILLRVRRAGLPDFDVTITRVIIKVRAVRWRIEGQIGYIRVSRFSERMENGIEEAFAAIHSELGSDLHGIVLDLRNNSGGLFDQSLILADAFLDAGEIVSVRGRLPQDIQSYTAAEGDLAKGVQVVVLINEGSASASEIVASALKYYRRASVLGTRSFGKGSVQTIMPLPVDGALKLTTALYYAPSGHTIQARGVQPDIVLKLAEAKNKQREKDLPGAFDAVDEVTPADPPIISADLCPAVGKKKDRQLGCALAFLQAGSRGKFLAFYRGGQ